MRFEPGDTVGPYRVTGVIGEGASGVVYQVVNSVTGRLDAMKILAGDYGHDLDRAQRFLREIQLQAKLEHPNIAQVRTAFCEGSTIVLVMELVDGEPLSSVLSQGPLPVDGAIRVAAQVLNALGMAHRQGVVHRDVKPANILIDRNGAVKLTDFGLAKHYGDPGQTAQGMAVGTVYYMAPEQVRGLAATDWRADLYAAGLILYEMLTGRRPFDGGDQLAVMRAHVETVPPPPSHWAPHLPKELDAIVSRALQKDPAQRFQSANGFLDALQGLPLDAAPPRPRNYWPYATCAAGLGSLFLAAFAFPPAMWTPRLEPLQLAMPAPPPVPAEALRLSAPVSEPEPAAAAVPMRRLNPAPARRAAPFTATNIHSAESARTVETPPLQPLPAEAAPLPMPPKLTIAEPAPPSSIPAMEAELPAGKPVHWMRRGLGRVPKLFRRRDPQPTPRP